MKIIILCRGKERLYTHISLSIYTMCYYTYMCLYYTYIYLYPSILCIPTATIAKYHRWGGLNSRNLFFQSCEGWKLEIKVSGGWFLPWPFPLACRWPPSQRVLVTFSVCVCNHWHISMCPNFLFFWEHQSDWTDWIQDHPSSLILI